MTDNTLTDGDPVQALERIKSVILEEYAARPLKPSDNDILDIRNKVREALDVDMASDEVLLGLQFAVMLMLTLRIIDPTFATFAAPQVMSLLGGAIATLDKLGQGLLPPPKDDAVVLSA